MYTLLLCHTLTLHIVITASHYVKSECHDASPHYTLLHEGVVCYQQTNAKYIGHMHFQPCINASMLSVSKSPDPDAYFDFAGGNMECQGVKPMQSAHDTNPVRLRMRHLVYLAGFGGAEHRAGGSQ